MKSVETVKETSRELVQSYILTSARRDWGIYAERFLLRLVEIAQSDVLGLDFKNKKSLHPVRPSFNYPNVEINQVGDAVVTVPVRELLPSSDYTNYKYVKEAVMQLQKQVITWEEFKRDKDGRIVADKNGKPLYIWKSVQIVGEAQGDCDISGVIRVRINANIWKAMLDFSKGFRSFDLKTALSLKSKYSFRIYQMVSRQKDPITFSLEDLKKQWGIDKEYKRFDNLLKRIIIPAKEELDSVSPYSFAYELVYAKGSGRGRKAVEKITFIPLHISRNEPDSSLKSQLDPVFMMLNPDIVSVLKKDYEFSHRQIKNNFLLFHEAQRRMTGSDFEHPSLLSFLKALEYGAHYAQKGKQAYIIGAVKRHLFEKYQFSYRSVRSTSRLK